MAKRHGALRTITKERKWAGITNDIVLPRTKDVNSGYVDFYVGIGEAHIETGISATPSGYKVFIGTGSAYGNQYWYSEYHNSLLNDGERVQFKVIHDYDNKELKVIVAGQEIETLPIAPQLYSSKGLREYDKIKMVMGVEDSYDNSHSQASFSKPKLRINGGKYDDFDGSIGHTFHRVGDLGGGSDSADQYTVYSALPLSASLDSK